MEDWFLVGGVEVLQRAEDLVEHAGDESCWKPLVWVELGVLDGVILGHNQVLD